VAWALSAAWAAWVRMPMLVRLVLLFLACGALAVGVMMLKDPVLSCSLVLCIDLPQHLTVWSPEEAYTICDVSNVYRSFGHGSGNVRLAGPGRVGNVTPMLHDTW
jgi:hypothetical protein